MNGEILRGEVYWVCVDDSVGAELQTGRPAVVVSANGVNAKENVVTVAFLTTGGFASPTRPSVEGPGGKKRRVCCEQLRAVDKSRLDRYESTLSEPELIRVTGAIASALSIPIPHGGVKPKEEKPSDDVVYSLRCEAEMWRRMYEKTMDQLVELRVNVAVARLTERAMEPVLEPVLEPIEKPVVKSALVEPDPGFEEEPEPKKKSEPKKKKSQKKEVAWNGVKVNVNTVATATELKNRTGMAIRTANEIVKTRKVVGKYDKLEDLLVLDHFGELSMKRYGHMLEV